MKDILTDYDGRPLLDYNGHEIDNTKIGPGACLNDNFKFDFYKKEKRDLEVQTSGYHQIVDKNGKPISLNPSYTVTYSRPESTLDITMQYDNSNAKVENIKSFNNNGLNGKYAGIKQPDPIPNDKPAMWDLVVEDMKTRDKIGLERYGTRLQPFNGRNSLQDAYEEVLDLAVYLRTKIYEETVDKCCELGKEISDSHKAKPSVTKCSEQEHCEYAEKMMKEEYMKYVAEIICGKCQTVLKIFHKEEDKW